MKAAFLTGIQKFEIREMKEPEIERDTDVLVRIAMVGICGSDNHYFRHGKIGPKKPRFPFIIGHEAAGVVEKTGRKATRVKPGQKIAIDPALSCGTCDQCRAGRENTCRSLHFLGSPGELEGCLREFIVVPENNCYPVPESMTFECAVLSEPLAIALYTVKRSQIQRGAHAAVLGAGPIGASVFHVLSEKGIRPVYVTDKSDTRLQYIRQFEPAWAGNPDRSDVAAELSTREPLGMDVIYECSGDGAAIVQGIGLLKPGGTLAIVGIPEPDEISFPIHELRRKEATLLNIRRQAASTQAAIDLLESGAVSLDSMVTHHFPLADAGRAFDITSGYKDGVMKTVVVL